MFAFILPLGMKYTLSTTRIYECEHTFEFHFELMFCGTVHGCYQPTTVRSRLILLSLLRAITWSSLLVNIPVLGGSCATTISWSGVNVLNDSFPVCGNSTIRLPIDLGDLYITALPCPTTAGPVVIDIIASISVLAPTGNYEVYMQQKFTCLRWSLHATLSSLDNCHICVARCFPWPVLQFNPCDRLSCPCFV